MNKNLIARASMAINAPGAKVWDALVNPEAIKQYMFGTNREIKPASRWPKTIIRLSRRAIIPKRIGR